MHPDMSWLGVLEHHALRTPDKPLAVFGDDVVTYRRDGRLGSAAGGRARTNAASVPATSSGLLSYNSIEFLATIFAANYLGAIAMPINWRLAAPELRYILEHSEARALVCDDALIDLAERSDAGSRSATSSGCASRTDTHAGWLRFADLGAGSTRLGPRVQVAAVTTSTG